MNQHKCFFDRSGITASCAECMQSGQCCECTRLVEGSAATQRSTAYCTCSGASEQCAAESENRCKTSAQAFVRPFHHSFCSTNAVRARAAHRSTWPGWTVKAMRGWGAYMRVAVPSCVMLCESQHVLSAPQHRCSKSSNCVVAYALATVQSAGCMQQRFRLCIASTIAHNLMPGMLVTSRACLLLASATGQH